jgi:hypothetical protein
VGALPTTLASQFSERVTLRYKQRLPMRLKQLIFKVTQRLKLKPLFLTCLIFGIISLVSLFKGEIGWFSLWGLISSGVGYLTVMVARQKKRQRRLLHNHKHSINHWIRNSDDVGKIIDMLRDSSVASIEEVKDFHRSLRYSFSDLKRDFKKSEIAPGLEDLFQICFQREHELDEVRSREKAEEEFRHLYDNDEGHLGF